MTAVSATGTVGIDGGFIRAPHKEGHFEVIAGKSMLSFRRHEDEDQGEPTGKCFAFVQTFDQKPKRRLFLTFEDNGGAFWDLGEKASKNLLKQ